MGMSSNETVKEGDSFCVPEMKTFYFNVYGSKKETRKPFEDTG